MGTSLDTKSLYRSRVGGIFSRSIHNWLWIFSLFKIESCPLFFSIVNRPKNQPKSYFLFHKNVSLRDFYIITLPVHTWRIPWKHETSSSSHYLSARSLKRVLGKAKFMQVSICFVFFLTHLIQKQKKNPYLYQFRWNRMQFIAKVT